MIKTASTIMGFLEDINHYRIAYRPPFRRKGINSLSYLILITFALLIPTITYVHTNQAFTRNNHWPSLSLNGPIDNIITDEHDGSVFVTVNGDIYKYASNLTLLSSSKSTLSSQATDGNNYLAKKTPSDISQNQIINKILTIVKGNNPSVFPRLLSCWQNKNLILVCLFYSVNDLRSARQLFWSYFDRNVTVLQFKSDSNEEMRILPDEDASKLLILTNRPTASENQLMSVVNASSDKAIDQSPHLPAMARFKITKSDRLDMLSVLPYGLRVKDFNPLYDYAYMFHYEDYTLFVLNDINKPIQESSIKDTTHAIKLARICKNDTDFDSYTEISITCRNQADIYAKTAHLDTTRTTGPILHIIYEVTKHDSSSKRSAKSYLCSYSMELIQDIFQKAISDCHSGHELSTMLAKLHPESSLPPRCQRNPSNDWCRSKTNPYIDGSSNRLLYNVIEDSSIELDGLASINFFHISRQGSDLKDVYHIGTEMGLLTKFSGEEDYLYTIDLFSHTIKNYRIEGEKLVDVLSNDTIASRRGTRYSLSLGNIMATTNTGDIHQLPIDSCQFYTSCHSCTINRDPLKCVWCENTCSKESDCNLDKQSASKCHPQIKYFEPTAGPLTGSTKLSIFGENFGSSDGRIEVNLDDQKCTIDTKTTAGDRIDCYVKPVNAPTNVTVSVKIFDNQGIVELNDTASSIVPYKYLEAKTFGLHPSFGPAGGGSELSVFGANLDIGANRSVFIGNTECMITKLSPNRINCRTNPWHPSIKQGNLISDSHIWQPFRVLIDGHELNMTKMIAYGGFNLSTTYQFREDIKQATDIMIDMALDHNSSDDSIFNLNLLVAVAIIATIILIIFYLKRYDGLARLRVKLPKAFESKNNSDETMVSFRNPHSQKFINTRPGGESLNGLIKLNGSVMSSDYFGKSDQLEQDKPLIHNFLDDEMMSILAQEKILVDRNKLTLGHVLGSGQFGRVYKGFLKVEETGEHAAVAVKTLHSRCHWDDGTDNRAFLDEGLMMKDFEHDNVLALIGVTFDSNGLPMVITPFMLYGDLRSYISDEASSPTVKELIEFGTQVAQGMAYLSNLKFVHRDLAARNCMLDENLTVKVADFGLSRDIYERDYYSSDNKKAKLPVKWMAIESLEKSIYSTKTDVWSFGVLLWELMTRGVVPYPDVDNFDLFSYLKEGRRMLRPRYCPVILYNIMLLCWNENPALRPTFDELVKSVSDVITKLQEAKDVDGQQTVSRDETYCDVLKLQQCY